ncbi:hypothetical protein [uncultured Jannaschia sp.]|uniref:hypothetical protein n=1 Tax=uncultured Jannaschia sp. TaxID=293347 RepID=UPI00261BFDA8|nr:hypothetical protein [uncultured Jannaschia sp.]
MAEAASAAQIPAGKADPSVFTLDLLRLADREAGSAAVAGAPNLSVVPDLFRARGPGGARVADTSLILSSGGAFDTSAPCRR